MSTGSSTEVQRLLWKPQEFAPRIGTSRSGMYRLIKAGLPVVRVLGSVRIDEDEALAWLKQNGDQR